MRGGKKGEEKGSCDTKGKIIGFGQFFQNFPNPFKIFPFMFVLKENVLFFFLVVGTFVELQVFWLLSFVKNAPNPPFSIFFFLSCQFFPSNAKAIFCFVPEIL